ncbi:NAD-dependent epimerase/dehydratase family protein [Patescibacteria group bacterium]|nr:NAD-dependent epimerase/dehydratase family protein [Patescibacteria group bacterium]
MKILVTGGAGFIGSNLTDRLISEGHQVVILDDFSAGNEKFVNPKSSVIQCDIRDAKKVDQAFASFKPDAVFHMAAQIDLRKSIEDPKADYAINVTGSKNVLSSAQKHGVKKFVFASSAAVYGDNQNLPIKESESIKAEMQYGKSKAEIEQALKESGIKSVVLRYANVYGPRQGTIGEGGVIAKFCKRLVRCELISIFGTGEQTRDFVFVQDIVDANIRALSSDKDFAIYNVSTARETSVNNIAGMLLKISGKNCKIKHLDPVKGEVMRNSLDNQLIKKELMWKPCTSLDLGLSETWKWFKERDISRKT